MFSIEIVKEGNDLEKSKEKKKKNSTLPQFSVDSG